MTGILLWSHSISSAALVLLCWWLCHENSRARPPGSWIALGYFVVGVSVLVTAFLRAGGAPTDAWVITTKVGLCFTFAAHAVRRRRLGPDR